jgi:hypothetical protein
MSCGGRKSENANAARISEVAATTGVPVAQARQEFHALIRELKADGMTDQTEIEAQARHLLERRFLTSDEVLDDPEPDYRMRHRPGGPDYGAPLHDVEEMFPDYYDMPGVYRTYDGLEPESQGPILASRGNPDAPVTVYRAVPAGVTQIRPGDWVTTSAGYAAQHNESNLDGRGTVLAVTVRAGDLWSEGNSIHEWGWHPSSVRSPALDQAVTDWYDEGMLDPEWARDSCRVTSETFTRWLTQHRGLAASTVALDRSGVFHQVTVVEGHVVDWTYRQFDEDCPVPVVEPVEEYLTRTGFRRVSG